MKINKILIVTGVLFMLSSCASNNLDHYKDTIPKADIKEYFSGEIQAWGIVQDWRGRVVRRFDVDMVGKWKGDVGTLSENFNYYDGKTQHRVWTIKKLADGAYKGTASDIIGEALGKTEGCTVQWDYVMDLPVGDNTYHVRFDDRMWVMNDGVLINRSYLKKFGIKVAELTIFMKKK